MAQTKTKAKEKPVESAPVKVKKRKIQAPTYKSFRLSKRIKHPRKISSSFSIMRQTFSLIGRNWRLYAGLAAVYFVLSMIFVRGLKPTVDLAAARDVSEQLVSRSNVGDVAITGQLIGKLFGTFGTTPTEVAGAYQGMLLVIMSLATIWAIRQNMMRVKVTVKEAFYKGMYPLVPFFLVLLVIGLQQIPSLFAIQVYGWVYALGLAGTGLEKFLWTTLLMLFILMTLYMVTSSIFALYIVTLPDVTPMQALRSARAVVLYRRWSIMRRLLFLPVAILLIGIVVMFPIVFFATPIAAWVFYALTMFSLIVVHGYIYTLYRDLLK